MGCKIIKQSERITKVEFSLEFDYVDGVGGFSFPCDHNGVINKNINPCALNNYEECMKNPQRFTKASPYIRKNKWSYTEPAVAQCVCGEVFQLVDEYMGACQCPKCEQWYNLFGQSLVDPTYWEEESEYEY